MSSKGSESGTNAPFIERSIPPLTIRLSKYNKPITPYHTRFLPPSVSKKNHNLDRFGWRSLSSPSKLAIPSSCEPASPSSAVTYPPYYSTVLIEIPVPFILSPYDRPHPSRFSLRCSRDRTGQDRQGSTHKNPHPPPVVHGPLLTRLRYRKRVMRLGANSI
jgi:hypothetical protein